MDINNEKLRILKMVENGKITAEEGVKLIEAIEDREREETVEGTVVEEVPNFQKELKGKLLKIRITDIETDEVKINLSFPLKFARFAKAMIPHMEKLRLEKEGINLEEILDSIGSVTEGKIVDIEDKANGHRIEVWIE